MAWVKPGYHVSLCPISGAPSGCLVKPHALNKEEVKAWVVKDVQTISSIEEPIAGPIDFYAAIARALKYNLDAKVKAMQVQLAHQQLNIAHYSLLPQVSANAGFDGCNNSAVV